MARIVERNGKYFVEHFAQGGTKRILRPVSSRKEAREMVSNMTRPPAPDDWVWFKNYGKRFDAKGIEAAARRFRPRETAWFVRNRRIALVTDDAHRFVPINPTSRMMLANGFSFDIVSTRDLDDGRLSEYNVAVFPGGFGYFPGRKTAFRIRQFVRSGGGYLGICAGAFLPLRPFRGIRGSGLSMLDARFDYLKERGVALVLLNPKDPIAFGIRGTARPLYALYPKLPEARKHTVCLPMLRANGPLILAGKKATVAGYYDGTRPFGAIVRGTYGKGRIVVLSAHPDAASSEIAGMVSETAALENLHLVKNVFLHLGGVDSAAVSTSGSR